MLKNRDWKFKSILLYLMFVCLWVFLKRPRIFIFYNQAKVFSSHLFISQFIWCFMETGSWIFFKFFYFFLSLVIKTVLECSWFFYSFVERTECPWFISRLNTVFFKNLFTFLCMWHLLTWPVIFMYVLSLSLFPSVRLSLSLAMTRRPEPRLLCHIDSRVTSTRHISTLRSFR